MQVLTVSCIVKRYIEGGVKSVAYGIKTCTAAEKLAIGAFFNPLPTLLPISMASVIQVYIGLPMSFPPVFYAYSYGW